MRILAWHFHSTALDLKYTIIIPPLPSLYWPNTRLHVPWSTKIQLSTLPLLSSPKISMNENLRVLYSYQPFLSFLALRYSRMRIYEVCRHHRMHQMVVKVSHQITEQPGLLQLYFKFSYHVISLPPFSLSCIRKFIVWPRIPIFLTINNGFHALWNNRWIVMRYGDTTRPFQVARTIII